VVGADGRAVEGEAACSAINDPDRSIPVQTTPAAVWQGAVNAPGCDGATNPAYDPARWERFFNLNYASLAVISDCSQAGRSARLAQGAESQGGFYSNRDNAYVYAHLSRKFGPLFVVRGRMPSVPRTFDGEAVMGSGQLRFWSLCQNESRVTTRTVDCLADRQVPLSAPGRDFTIVMSRAADRPANASVRCGVAWLDWGLRGDAAGRADYGLLVIRNMLPAAGFKEAIQNVAKPGGEEAVMGPYFPRGAYLSRAAFEKQGCDPARLTLGAASLSSDGAGRTVVRVGCAPARDECTGRLRLTAAGRRIGGARFTIAGGTTQPVPVRLRAPARRTLRSGATLSVAVTARARSPFVVLTAKRTSRLTSG
jgi:hypothetical protein